MEKKFIEAFEPQTLDQGASVTYSTAYRGENPFLCRDQQMIQNQPP